jgi:D-glycero-D-manno-heptose 1,7-bisphosphate phosphatase
VTRPAVFLDRDGTLNRDVGYPADFSRIEIYPYSYESVRRLNRAGYAAVVVTNQSGVARGLIEEDALRDIHRRMDAAFRAADARIDAFFYCPHHPEAAVSRYRRECPNRKPSPGMALQAAADLDLDLSRSFMIGDKVEDVLFGYNGGLTPILVQTGYGREALPRLTADGFPPARVALHLGDAVNWILQRGQRGGRPG